MVGPSLGDPCQQLACQSAPRNAHALAVGLDVPPVDVVGIAIEVRRIGGTPAVGALVAALLPPVVGVGAGAIALETGERVLDQEAADLVVALGERRRGPEQRQRREGPAPHASSRSCRVSSPSASRSSWVMVKWSAPATGISAPGRCSADRLACSARLSATSGGSSAVP